MTTVSRRAVLAAWGTTLTGALLAGGAPAAFAASTAETGVIPNDPYAP